MFAHFFRFHEDFRHHLCDSGTFTVGHLPVRRHHLLPEETQEAETTRQGQRFAHVPEEDGDVTTGEEKNPAFVT